MAAGASTARSASSSDGPSDGEVVEGAEDPGRRGRRPSGPGRSAETRWRCPRRRRRCGRRSPDRARRTRRRGASPSWRPTTATVPAAASGQRRHSTLRLPLMSWAMTAQQGAGSPVARLTDEPLRHLAAGRSSRWLRGRRRRARRAGRRARAGRGRGSSAGRRNRDAWCRGGTGDYVRSGRWYHHSLGGERAGASLGGWDTAKSFQARTISRWLSRRPKAQAQDSGGRPGPRAFMVPLTRL